MRLWHLVFGILVVSIVLTVTRDPVGRVAVVVFVTTLGEVVFGTTSLLVLFQTVAAIGCARGWMAHAEAVLATTAVLALATLVMVGWLVGGVWLAKAVLA